MNGFLGSLGIGFFEKIFHMGSEFLWPHLPYQMSSTTLPVLSIFMTFKAPQQSCSTLSRQYPILTLRIIDLLNVKMCDYISSPLLIVIPSNLVLF